MKPDEQHFNTNYENCDIVYVPLALSVPSKAIRQILERWMKESRQQADFGCGHGVGLWVMKTHAPAGAKLTGIDYSQVAIAKAARYVGGPGVQLKALDFCEPKNASLPHHLDFLYSNQVIEHLPDTHAFLESCYQCLKPGGKLYIGTVLKKPWAWYFYRNEKGERVLEPTHVREYTQPDQLLGPMAHGGFHISLWKRSPVVYPIVDPLLKILSRFWKGPGAFAFLNSAAVMTLRRYLVVPIPGYSLFQILAQKPEAGAHARPGSRGKKTAARPSPNPRRSRPRKY